MTEIAVSIALLLIPYFGFGLGLDRWLRRRLVSRAAVLTAPAVLILPYLVFALPRHELRWTMCLGMLAISLTIGVILYPARTSKPVWRDWVVLGMVGVLGKLHIFNAAWPVEGLGGVPKLLLMDATLYGYLVVRPMDGIGYHWRLRAGDAIAGLREFLYFAPLALPFGLATHFLHIHKATGGSLSFVSAWLLTMFLVAMPEELLFRGLLLNLLEKRMGPRRALCLSALVFGAAHFHRQDGFFDWQYVTLAAGAGLFYGRAWLAQRRLLASSITHSTVDAIWSVWLR